MRYAILFVIAFTLDPDHTRPIAKHLGHGGVGQEARQRSQR